MTGPLTIDIKPEKLKKIKKPVDKGDKLKKKKKLKVYHRYLRISYFSKVKIYCLCLCLSMQCAHLACTCARVFSGQS